MVGGRWSVVSWNLISRSFCLASKRKKNLLKVIVIGTFLFLGLLACSERKAGRSGIEISESDSYAATLYRQNCAICHGTEAYGKVVDEKPVPGLRFGKIKKKTRKEIYQQISHGKLPMPSFAGQLTEKEINLLVDFIMYDLQAREKKKSKDSKEGKKQGGN